MTAGIPVIGAAKQLIDAGRAIRKSKHKEDYLNSGFGAFSAGMGAANAFGNLFTSPLATSASLNYSKSQNSYHREERMSVGSRLHVKGGVEYNGKNLHTVNLNMLNEGDTVYNITGNIIREAGKSTIKESTGSRGYGLSLAKGSDGMNPFKGNGTTVTAGTNGSRGKSEGVYYTNPKDETKGNSHYNVGGDVKDSGVDIKTGSVSGKIEGNHTVESLQDRFDSRSRGYSISTGIGINSTKGNKGTTYNTNIQSVSAGYSQGKTVQRITREVSEFTAGSGMLEVKGETRQTGSLIDGGFTLNTGGYSKEDLHDVNKTRNVGVNVTVYPNVSYSQRDKNGNQVYIDGSNPKKTGVAIKTGLIYGETDKTREVFTTVGESVKINQDISGVNRDPNRQMTEFEGRELETLNVDLLTEYWVTEAGRGKLKDLIENSERTVDGIKRILTTRDENGNLNILKSVEAESAVQKFMRIGYVDTKGKTQQQIKQELETRFGSLAKKGVKVYFYGEKDLDTSKLDNATKTKLLANGFAITKDGTVWINKSHVDSGKVIDFNTLTQHEISHILFGDDSEYQAQYVEAAYREFLTGLARNGYAQDGSGITDYSNSMLTVHEIARLNGYTDEEMQKFINGFMEGLIGKKNWRGFKNVVQANVKRVPIVGAATSKILTKVSKADRKISDREGKNVGIGVRKKKISVVKPVESVKYVAKSFAVTKKEQRNKGTTKVIKAAKYYEKFDDELDADEKDNVLDNIIIQNTENVRKGGTSYTENLFTTKRITDFINNPTRKATLIENDKEEGFDNRVIAISQGIYKDIWNAVDSGKKEVKIGGTIFEIYNRTSLDSGMDAMTLINKNTREVRIIYQGSVPAIHQRADNPESWDRDWPNNLFGNTPIMADLLYAPSKLIGGSVNAVGKAIRGIGKPISENPLYIETGTVPSSLEGMFGNYVKIPTDKIGKGIVSTGDSIMNAGGYLSSASHTERYKSDEPGTPKQYIDGYNYSIQMEKELQKKYNNPNLKIKSHDGHSLAGGIAIYVGSRRNTEVIAVDSAPVNNPGPYINNNRMLTIVPDHGNALLNQTIRVNGRDTSRFSPGTGMIKNTPIPKSIKNGLSSIIPSIIGVGKGANGKLAVYDNIGAEPGSFGHEPNYEELKQKNDKEMDSFMMPKGAVK